MPSSIVAAPDCTGGESQQCLPGVLEVLHKVLNEIERSLLSLMHGFSSEVDTFNSHCN